MTGWSLTSDPLQRLRDDIARCRICRDAPHGKPLPHEPRPVAQLGAGARILIAGQAPGLRVHESGLPFDDRSGDRLRGWMGICRDVFYHRDRIAILPMGFCFPGYDTAGSDLPPRRECAPKWREAALAALPNIELILVIGGYAQTWHLPRAGAPDISPPGVTTTILAWRAIAEATRPRIIVLPHPSWRNTGWLKKNPWFDAEVLPFLRAEIARLLSRG